MIIILLCNLQNPAYAPSIKYIRTKREHIDIFIVIPLTPIISHDNPIYTMELFVSSFVNKIDKKGRVSLPSIYRSALPKDHKNEIILLKSLRKKTIEGLSVLRVKEIASRINNLDFFSDEHDDFTTSIFSEMLPTNLDKEGRFLLPEKLKDFASIKNEVAFIGQGFFFQIVNPKIAQQLQNNSRKRLNSNKKTLRKILGGRNAE
tara:strand:+ start:263 stop:874 length:612 start_codon:yes stop_codon:yes gene_type:complete